MEFIHHNLIKIIQVLDMNSVKIEWLVWYICIYKGYFVMAYSTVAQILYTLCSSKSIKSRTFWWTTVKVGYYLFQNRHEESWNEHTTEGSLFTWFFHKKVFLYYFMKWIFDLLQIWKMKTKYLLKMELLNSDRLQSSRKSADSDWRSD